MSEVRKWRIATRRKGYSDWDIGLTPMTEKMAKATARKLSATYRGYQHKAIKVGK